MEEWKEYKLGDVLCEKGYIRGPFGSALKRGDLLNEGIPVYEQQHAIYNKREFRFYISYEKYNEMKRFTVYPEDIIISCSGTVGEVSLIKKEDPQGIISQALLLLRANRNIILPEYLLYFFKTAKGHNSITSRSSGSVQVNIARREVIESIPLCLPSLDIQKKIVKTLKSLDDKIELNNRINHNLEEQAILAVRRFIFSDNISTMQKLSLSDVCFKITDGSHYSPKDELGSNIPMLSVKDMGHYAFDYSSCKHISESDYLNMLSNDCVPQIDDVLVAKDGSYLKELFINKTIKKQAILSSIAIFRPNLSLISPELLLYILKQPQVIKEAKDNYVSGSALPRIVLKDFKKLSFNLPPVSQQKEIRDYLASTYSLINHNHNENERLIQSRDALIVKLMNKYTC